ncbi:MAG: CPBP family intramembrane metalloprotease [Prevotella sp.]|nr:CPBP family intramembrane metalloprotease [Prevotella sp.]
MKQHVRKWMDIAMYLVAFLMIQVLVGIIVELFFHGNADSNPTPVIIISLVSSLLTIILFAWRKWFPITRAYLQTHPWTTLLWVVVLTLGTIIPSQWLEELMGLEMSEDLERLMSQIMSSPLGYVVIGILVPLAEEIVFRGAILRTLLKLFPERKHWIAIIISAIIFGAAHGNAAQFVHAALLGILLGWMYWRTDSIVPGVVLHWVNNSIAYILTRLFPDMADASLVEIFKGNEQNVLLAVGFSLLIFLPALFQLNQRLKKPRSETTVLS